MGTPDFAVPTLEMIIKAGHDVLAVVTQPDKPNSRGKKVIFSPVKQLALDNNIKVYQPDRIKDKEFIQEIMEMEPDLIAVVAYGKILPQELLTMPRYGCINLHGSLLPEYRGPAPIHRAVIEGKSETGVTTMLMDIGLDTGDMIYKFKTEISAVMETGELHDILASGGAALMVKTIADIEKCIAPREKQDDSKATYAPLLTKETGKIHWNQKSSELHNLIRGTSPSPGAYTILDGNRVKIAKSAIPADFGNNTEEASLAPGTVIKADKEGLLVKTGDGALLIREIQLPGKKRMPVSEFIKGNKALDGKIFI